MIQVAFYDENANIKEVLKIKLENKNTLVPVKFNDYIACLPNYGDWSFLDVALDKKSLEFFSKNTKNLKSLLSKMLIAKCFYDQYISTEISLN